MLKGHTGGITAVAFFKQWSAFGVINRYEYEI